jgi:hypothetical protein
MPEQVEEEINISTTTNHCTLILVLDLLPADHCPAAGQSPG